MDGRWAVLSVLALLAAGVDFSHADVTPITLESMTWDATPALTVCATEALDTNATAYHLVVADYPTNSSLQTPYGGTADDLLPTCATFTNIVDTLPLPLSEETTYEFIVYADAVEKQQGAVTFAFPLSEGTAIDCGTSLYARFSFTGDDTTAVSDGCLLTTDLCYVAVTETDPLCVPGLDTSQENEDFEVCVPPSGQEITAGEITDVRFTYDEDRSTGSFTILPAVTPSTQLLCTGTVGGIPDTTLMSECTTTDCPFDALPPSKNVYELCRVYDDAGTLTVGTFSFQDVMLTVGTTETTIDFGFANVGYNDDYTYNVYGGTDATTVVDTFTLDCSHVQDSFCNGFFDGTTITYIGVSSVSMPSNVVIAPVSSSVVYKKNATTFDNTKTENIVSISV